MAGTFRFEDTHRDRLENNSETTMGHWNMKACKAKARSGQPFHLDGSSPAIPPMQNPCFIDEFSRKLAWGKLAWMTGVTGLQAIVQPLLQRSNSSESLSPIQLCVRYSERRLGYSEASRTPSLPASARVCPAQPAGVNDVAKRPRQENRHHASY